MQKHLPKLKTLVRVLAFVLLAALLLAAASGVLTPKSKTMAAFYAEPKNTVDVLFVGGSHAAAAFDPIQLWQQQGYAGYTLYSWGQPAWTTYHYVVEALKTQTPKVVVAEGFGFMYGSSYLEEANFDSVSDDYSLQMRPSLNRLQLAMAMAEWQQAGRPFYQYNPLLRYHGRWKALTSEDFLWPFMNHSSSSKGFGPVYTFESFSQPTPPTTIPAASLYAGCEAYLNKLIQLSQKQGFQLIIALAPYIIEQADEWGVLQHMQAICQANNVPFLNYNDPALLAESGFAFEEDMAEHAHVNLFGAEKITTHIGRYLAQNTPLPNRREDPAYASWHTAAAAESWDKTKMRLRLAPAAAQWLPRLNEENLAAFLVGHLNTAGVDTAPLAAGLQALGLDTAFLEQGGNLLAMLDGGQIAWQQTAPLGGALSHTQHLNDLAIELAAGSSGASISLNGQPRSLNYPDGLHVLVVDKTDGSIVQVVAFLPEEGFLTRTD